jgi:hypothetical protein
MPVADRQISIYTFSSLVGTGERRQGRKEAVTKSCSATDMLSTTAFIQQRIYRHLSARWTRCWFLEDMRYIVFVQHILHNLDDVLIIETIFSLG